MLSFLRTAGGMGEEGPEGLPPSFSVDSEPSAQETPEMCVAHTAEKEYKSALSVLAEIKAHSQSLAVPLEELEEEGEHGFDDWDEENWRDAFTRLVEAEFVDTPEQGTTTGRQDDMLFFVRQELKGGWEAYPEVAPFFVRRWAPALPANIPEPNYLMEGSPFNEEWAQLDWRHTLYLNLTLHTTYTLTVAVCSRQAILEKHHGEGSAWAPLVKVSSQVYASPTRISVDSKESNKHSYPDIFFSLEDTEVHQYVVLNDPDHCLCVLLSAKGGVALPAEPPADGEAPGEAAEPRVLVFSGFVGYDQLRTAYQNSHRRFGGLLPGKQGEAAKVMMRGPGTNGEAEVAVMEAQTTDLDAAAGKKRGIVRKAVSVGAALLAGAGQSKHSGGAAEAVQLQCSLVSVCLPNRVLSHDLLFKPCA